MLTAQLHPYQDPAVDKFLGRGNMLAAMDMGTGKTIVSIAAAEELLGCGDVNLCMAVVPGGLKYQWAQSIAKFTDIPTRTKKVKNKTIVIPKEPHGIVIDGSPGWYDDATDEYHPGSRDKLYSMIGPETDYVILSYDSVLDDFLQVSKIKPQMVVCDEITQIKSPGAKRSMRIKSMLNAKYRLGLTGTPIDNMLEDLYSIMEWVDPDLLGPYEWFDKSYIDRDGNGVVLGYKNTHILREKLEPVLYRKRKTDPDVAPYMPNVQVDHWPVDMDPATRTVYRVIAGDLLGMLESARLANAFDLAAHYTGKGKQLSENSELGKIMARQQAVSLFLDHPDLIFESASDYEDSQKQKKAGVKKKIWPGSKYCKELVDSGTLDDIFHSAKLDVLVRNCKRLLDADPVAKILIYTKYRRMLEVMQAAFGLPCVQYKGGMTAASKAAAIQQFTDDPGCKLFLSSHAGAYGCDMYMANHLVNYDHPEAAGKADQINNRHVRASSEFGNVFVHNMYVDGTLEMRDLDRLDFKRTIGSAFLDGEGADAEGRIRDTRGTLTSWLRASLEAG